MRSTGGDAPNAMRWVIGRFCCNEWAAKIIQETSLIRGDVFDNTAMAAFPATVPDRSMWSDATSLSSVGCIK